MRWMEHYGLYYFFEQSAEGEKLIITDTSISHSMFEGSQLTYLPVSGLDDNIREDVVYNFIAEYSSVPKDVLVKDYSYQHPSMVLQGKADVYEDGVGTYYKYGESFQDPQDTSKIALVRAQAFQCRQTQMHGESLCPAMLTGYSVSLQEHFHSEFNGEYLLTKVQHKARNRTAFTTAMGTQRQAEEKKSVYSNSFTTIPLKQQFRRPNDTEKPRFFGLLSAHIDAAGVGKYAQLDKYGRYKVILPFDLSGRKEGKASSWLRLAEPYAGPNYGLHFPLLKGTEVLISFVEGDIDRPVILSAIHNFEQMNHVKDSNQPINSILTAGGNQFVMGDSTGKGFIGMRLPNSQGGWVLAESGDGSGSGSAGSHSNTEGKGGDDGGKSGDDSGGESGGDSGGEDTSEDSSWFSYDKEHFACTFSQKTEITGGTSTEVGYGIKNELFVGGKADVSAGFSWGADLGTVIEYFKGDKVEFGSEGITCTEESTSMYEKEYWLRVGPKSWINKTLSRLKTCFGILIASSATSSLSEFITFETEFGNKENLNDGFSSWASITTNAVSGAEICFGAAVMAWVHKLQKSVQSTAKTADIGTSFKLSKAGGVNIKVNPGLDAATEDSRIIMSVEKGGINTNEFEMDAKNIKLSNQGVAVLELRDDTLINLEQRKDTGTSGFSVRKDDVYMRYMGDSYLSIEKDTIWLTPNLNDSYLMVKKPYAVLKSGPSQVTVSQENGISMNAPNLKTEAEGTVKISAAGIISLG